LELIAPAWRNLRLELPDLSTRLAALPTEQVQSEIGPIWVHARDELISRRIRRKGRLAEEEVALLQRVLRPGMVAVDIGANIGYLTLAIARAVGRDGRVVAIEADPSNYALLCANVWQACFGWVDPVCAAAARTTGMTKLWLDAGNFGGHHAFARDEASKSIEVPAVRLDDLLTSDTRIDVVKVDIQGMDHAALEGMTDTLHRDRPTVLAEFAPLLIADFGDEPTSVLALYRRLGFSVTPLEQPEEILTPDKDAEFVEDLLGRRRQHTNLVLRPFLPSVATGQVCSPHRSRT
jgi:FkbM family methyltransferase